VRDKSDRERDDTREQRLEEYRRDRLYSSHLLLLLLLKVSSKILSLSLSTKNSFSPPLFSLQNI